MDQMKAVRDALDHLEGHTDDPALFLVYANACVEVEEFERRLHAVTVERDRLLRLHDTLAAA